MRHTILVGKIKFKILDFINEIRQSKEPLMTVELTILSHPKCILLYLHTTINICIVYYILLRLLYKVTRIISGAITATITLSEFITFWSAKLLNPL